jgi:hypothetical protein
MGEGEKHMKPTAWYDPTNGMVSTDKDSPLFTPLGQVLPLYLQQEWVGLTDEEMLECLKAVDVATAVNLLMSQYEMPPTFKVYAEAIGAKLKEKNE